MQVEMNIGLTSKDGRNAPHEVMDRAVRAVSLLSESLYFGRIENRFKQARYEGPDGPVVEPTLVVRTVACQPLLSIRHLIRYLAGRMGQDCIAVRFEDDRGGPYGELIGPRAQAWGDFNPDFFIRYDAVASATDKEAA